MTQEKQLLIKDLCSRLPYNVICKLSVKGADVSITEKLDFGGLEHFMFGTMDVKPYLRPMSSMTEEEKEEIEVFIFNEWYEEDSCKIDNEGWIEILANYDVSGIDPRFCGDYVDWLNANHFDWRGLIPMGLALEAPEGMYKD